MGNLTMSRRTFVKTAAITGAAAAAFGASTHTALAEETYSLSLIHISEPTRQAEISYAVFCLKKKKKHQKTKKKNKKQSSQSTLKNY